MDSIIIRDLKLETIIGTNPDERTRRQQVIINLQLDCDLSKASQSDELTDTVDYFTIEERVTELGKSSSFKLVERLAGAIADLCLENKQVNTVTVEIDKPDALLRPRSVAIRLVRSNS